MLSDLMGHRERTICSQRFTEQQPFPGSSLDPHPGHRAGGTAVSVLTGLVLPARVVPPQPSPPNPGGAASSSSLPPCPAQLGLGMTD